MSTVLITVCIHRELDKMFLLVHKDNAHIDLSFPSVLDVPSIRSSVPECNRAL